MGNDVAERITEISEYRGKPEGSWSTQAGFKITTTAQEIILSIDDESSCCESWGYFLTEDDSVKFIGASLLGVTLTDTNRSARTFGNDYRDDPNHESLDDGDVMFVDIETDRGVLQFVAYNAHNGYYGHEARVSSKQLAHSVTL